MASSMSLKQRAFAAWKMTALQMANAALKAENDQLEKITEKRKASLWTMRRVELDEVARRELGMTEGALAKETVISLRERIRAAREAAYQESDPLKRIPGGLDRMKAAQLVEECVRRGLNPNTEGGKSKTRPQMIVMIRDDVESRISASTTPPMNQSRGTTRSSSQKRRSAAAGSSEGPMEWKYDKTLGEEVHYKASDFWGCPNFYPGGKDEFFKTRRSTKERDEAKKKYNLENGQCRKKRCAGDIQQYKNPDFETDRDFFGSEYIAALQPLAKYRPGRLEELKAEYGEQGAFIF